MGFRMKNKFYLKLAVSLSGFIFSSCIKPNSTKIDYGPEVSEDLVLKTIVTSIGPTDSPGQILKEETVKISRTQYVRDRPIIDVLSVTNLTAVEKHETAKQWQVNITSEFQKLDPYQKDNIFPVIISEDPRCWNKSTRERENCEVEEVLHRQSALNPNPVDRNLIYKIEDRIAPFQEFGIKTSSAIKPYSYHKLTVTRGKFSPPEAVKNAPNCQNIPDCLINGSVVEFDFVDWSQSREGTKIHHHYFISPDVPQMARFLESCQQGSIPVPQPGGDPQNPPRFLVTICDSVNNYIPGKL